MREIVFDAFSNVNFALGLMFAAFSGRAPVWPPLKTPLIVIVRLARPYVTHWFVGPITSQTDRPKTSFCQIRFIAEF